jgi:hypothetical protein
VGAGGTDPQEPFQLKHLMFYEIRVNVAMEISEELQQHPENR